MIQIKRPALVPVTLRVKGKNARRMNSRAYTMHSGAYVAGTRQFQFSSAIYAAVDVKAALSAAQHGKCCFCERLIEDDGDVEHFRPKRAWQQSPGHPVHRPGYYWLAYEWSNLLLSCSACNSRNKRNLFPLADPARRALNHTSNIHLEDPLFVNPAEDDPMQHIGFRGEIPFAVNGSTKGAVTIEHLRLRVRSGLKESRLQRLQLLKQLFQLTKLAATQPENHDLQIQALKAQELLMLATNSSAEYAAAARFALSTEFEFVPD